MKIEILDEVSSTNEYIKRYLASGEDRIVVAKRQTGGKGTKGRSFLSGEGGVYLSVLRFFSDLPARDAFRLMQHAAVAVCKTAESFGAQASVKWANDVLVGGKKLAGILIENEFSGAYIRNSIVGIGLNACNDLKELNGIAVSLSDAVGRRISAEEARNRLIEEFCGTGLFESEREYERRLLLGNATVTAGEESYAAVIKRVLPDGRLCVLRGEEEILLSAGEISLKI